MVKFEVGRQYSHGYAGDSSLFSFYYVVRRTDKSVWIDKDPEGKGQRKKISVYNDRESITLGNYSMAPVIDATDIITDEVVNEEPEVLELNKIHNIDCLEGLRMLPDESVNCCITSPPYWGLRDYGVEGQIGLEESLQDFLARLVIVFDEVRRVLKPDGTLWVNMGDAYVARGGSRTTETDNEAFQSRTEHGSEASASRYDRNRTLQSRGLKPKDLMGQPWRLAFALQDAGWYLRSDIIWHKPNPMPESVKDRPTKAHEYMFLLTKSQKYYYDHQAVREPRVSDEDANGFRGGSYCEYETFDNAETGKRKTTGNIKHTEVGFGHGTDRQKRKRDRVGGSSGAGGPPQSRQRIKAPDGWDKGSGAHGTIHRNGREKGEYVEYQSDGLRNRRTVWTISTQPFKTAHFATFPEKLIEPCIVAGCPPDGVVLDPFMGSGTTAKVAIEKGRQFIGFELNPEYIDIANERLSAVQISLF